MQNSILGMASRNLSNSKPAILGATPGAILGIGGHPHERFSFAPVHSRSVFIQELGWSPCARSNSPSPPHAVSNRYDLISGHKDGVSLFLNVNFGFIRCPRGHAKWTQLAPDV